MAQQPIEDEEPFERINASKVKELYDSHSVTWMDVRTPNEVSREGHIPGSRMVPMDILLENPWKYLKTDNVIFVCSEGIRSALACDLAAAIGLTKICILEDGILGCGGQRIPDPKVHRVAQPSRKPAGTKRLGVSSFLERVD